MIRNAQRVRRGTRRSARSRSGRRRRPPLAAGEPPGSLRRRCPLGTGLTDPITSGAASTLCNLGLVQILRQTPDLEGEHDTHDSDHYGPDPGDRDQGSERRAGGSESEDAEGHLRQAEEEQHPPMGSTRRAANAPEMEIVPMTISQQPRKIPSTVRLGPGQAMMAIPAAIESSPVA